MVDFEAKTRAAERVGSALLGKFNHRYVNWFDAILYLKICSLNELLSGKRFCEHTSLATARKERYNTN